MTAYEELVRNTVLELRQEHKKSGSPEAVAPAEVTLRMRFNGTLKGMDTMFEIKELMVSLRAEKHI